MNNLRFTSSPAAAPSGGILLTGFDAFDGDASNPSWMAVRLLDGQCIAGQRVTAALLPTAFSTSAPELARLIHRHQPELVIGVGVARGRAALSLERIAINVNDARIADNLGEQPIDVPVVAAGPAAYFSSLPIKAMLQTLRQAGVAAEVSQSAGTFVCNHVFYHLMHLLARQAPARRARGGFIHVPGLPEGGDPSMPLSEIVRGLRLALECAVLTRADLMLQAGSIDGQTIA